MTTEPEASADRPKRQRRARTTGRLAAVQALYQIDVTEADSEAVIEDFVAHRLQEAVDGVQYRAADREHFERVVRGVSLVRDDVDDMLSAVLAEGWTVPRLEPLLRAIMRAAAFEIADLPDIPVRVVIGEYLAVAHAFFTEREPAMVNGVLDAIARALRPEELEAGASDRPAAD
ncbi:MAG: transcription antitermination factor NusB [Alphaproteobacteria bacterium]